MMVSETVSLLSVEATATVYYLPPITAGYSLIKSYKKRVEVI